MRNLLAGWLVSFAGLLGCLLAPGAALAQNPLQQLNQLGQTKTSLFGLEAEGTSFVYVFDRSGSMDVPDGKPLKAAKEELIRSLDALGEVQQFQIIFYNQFQTAFTLGGGGGKLIFGEDDNKAAAKKFIEGIKAAGATRHEDALALAVKLKPNVIFLLTDGDENDDMTDAEVERILKLNTAAAKIFVLQCSPPDKNRDNHLVKLAEQTGGKHLYLDITKPKK